MESLPSAAMDALVNMLSQRFGEQLNQVGVRLEQAMATIGARIDKLETVTSSSGSGGGGGINNSGCDGMYIPRMLHSDSSPDTTDSDIERHQRLTPQSSRSSTPVSFSRAGSSTFAGSSHPLPPRSGPSTPSSGRMQSPPLLPSAPPSLHHSSSHPSLSIRQPIPFSASTSALPPSAFRHPLCAAGQASTSPSPPLSSSSSHTPPHLSFTTVSPLAIPVTGQQTNASSSSSSAVASSPPPPSTAEVRRRREQDVYDYQWGTEGNTKEGNSPGRTHSSVTHFGALHRGVGR